MSQGERRGSLEFVRNETSVVDFKKKFGTELSEAIPDIMADTSDDYGAASAMGWATTFTCFYTPVLMNLNLHFKIKAKGTLINITKKRNKDLLAVN